MGEDVPLVEPIPKLLQPGSERQYIAGDTSMANLTLTFACFGKMTSANLQCTNHNGRMGNITFPQFCPWAIIITTTHYLTFLDTKLLQYWFAMRVHFYASEIDLFLHLGIIFHKVRGV